MNTPAPRAVAHSLLAAAWRENIHHIRDHTHTNGTTLHIPTSHNTTLTVTATPLPFAQIQPQGPIRHGDTTIDDPVTLLRLLTPQAPTQLADELRDAHKGLALARTRHQHHTHTIAANAEQHHTHTTTALAEHLTGTDPTFLPCRLFEPLAVSGHHLHPCARTRLGWTHADRQRYDLETPDPIHLRFISAHPDRIDITPNAHDQHIGTLLQQLHPHLNPGNDNILIPIHPWQYDNIVQPQYRHLFTDGALTTPPDLTLPCHPTASIRTLITPTGHYLKCSLSIHITSTNRGISPATAHNGPHLSRTLTHIIDTDPILRPRIRILPEHAAIALPGSRDLTCLLRESLANTSPEALPIPATALTATSPVTGLHIVSELADTHGDPADFLRHYSDLLITATLHLAGQYGIATEAHLQNCVPTFIAGTPHRIILRDLGGTRILTSRLHTTGHHPDLHHDSVVTTTDPDTMRAKLTYTLFQNHLTAIITALDKDQRLPAAHGWQIVAHTLANTEIPRADRDFHTAATVPHKALLTMRLTGENDHYVPVPNPLATP